MSPRAIGCAVDDRAQLFKQLASYRVEQLATYASFLLASRAAQAPGLVYGHGAERLCSLIERLPPELAAEVMEFGRFLLDREQANVPVVDQLQGQRTAARIACLLVVALAAAAAIGVCIERAAVFKHFERWPGSSESSPSR
jgi:hypothetical protein